MSAKFFKFVLLFFVIYFIVSSSFEEESFDVEAEKSFSFWDLLILPPFEVAFGIYESPLAMSNSDEIKENVEVDYYFNYIDIEMYVSGYEIGRMDYVRTGSENYRKITGEVIDLDRDEWVVRLEKDAGYGMRWDWVKWWFGNVANSDANCINGVTCNPDRREIDRPGNYQINVYGDGSLIYTKDLKVIIASNFQELGSCGVEAYTCESGVFEGDLKLDETKELKWYCQNVYTTGKAQKYYTNDELPMCTSPNPAYVSTIRERVSLSFDFVSDFFKNIFNNIRGVF